MIRILRIPYCNLYFIIELDSLSVSTGDGSPNSAYGGGPLSPRHALRELEKAMPKVNINVYISAKVSFIISKLNVGFT